MRMKTLNLSYFSLSKFTNFFLLTSILDAAWFFLIILNNNNSLEFDFDASLNAQTQTYNTIAQLDYYIVLFPYRIA